MSWVLQLIRGGALATILAVVVLAIALLANLSSGTSIAVYPLAALVAVAYTIIPDRATATQVLGSTIFGIVALGLGLWTGFGEIEISGLAGAVAAGLVLARGLSWKRRIPYSALAAIALIVVVANLIPLILDGGGLNHDESAYALKARHWSEGTSESGWSVHRGIAMSAYGYLVFEAGAGEEGLRIFGVTALVGFVIATWILGKRVGGGWVGAMAAIALLSGPVLLRRSTEYLSDVPSSALLMATMIVVWRHFGERDKPGYGMLWLLPLAWAAFYIRYQSVLAFTLIAITIVVLFGEKVRTGWRPIALTAGLGLAGLVPHFIFATSETGSPLGIMLFTADVAGRDYWGQGLVEYFLLMGWPLAAFIGPAAVVFFVWWLIADWRVLRERTKCLFLMIPAAGQVLILGVLSHGEARFIFFPLGLTLIGGAIGATVLLRRWKPRTAQAVGLGLAVLLLGSLAMATNYVRGAVESRSSGTEILEEVAVEMRAVTGNESCGVMTSYFPQMTYLSECGAQQFRTYLDAAEALERVPGEVRFLLLVDDGKNQPEGSDLAEIIALTTGEPIEVRAGGESAEIYTFAP